MRNSKKLLCLIMAIAVMMGSMGLVNSIVAMGADSEVGGTLNSSEALTGDPEYLVKFTDDLFNSPKWLSCDTMTSLYGEKTDQAKEYVFVKDKTNSTAGSSVKVNSNNSLTISKNGNQYGANLEIPVTAAMRENYLKAKDKKLYISYYLSKAAIVSGTAEGEFSSAQFRIYTKFKTTYKEDEKDNNNQVIATRDRRIKLTSVGTGKPAYQCYQQCINRTLYLYGPDGKALDNLDNVESLIFSLYDSSPVIASLEVSGITYAGVPEITKFKAPDPAGINEYVSMTDWSKHYLKDDFGDTPNTVKYNPNGGYNDKEYSSIVKNAQNKLVGVSGWTYFKNSNDVVNKQLNLFFNFNRDDFNKAIVTANQPGGNKKLKIKGKIPVLQDTEGKEMMAEFQVMFKTYNSSKEDAVVLTQEWIKQNQEFEFELDSSKFDINSVEYVKLAVMAFWRYDKDTNLYYDVDKAKRYDKDGNVLAAKYNEAGDFIGYDNGKSETLLKESDVAKITANCSNGKKDVDITKLVSGNKLSLRVMKNVEGFISPIYTGEKTTTPTSSSKTDKTSKTTSGEYEYAGYHFYDFTAQAYSETYGDHTHASFVNFLSADHYDSYEIVDKNYNKDGMKQGWKNDKNPGKTVKGNSKYVKDYEEAKKLASGGYQLEISSPYPRVQQQHQAFFFPSGSVEDESRTSQNGDHKVLKPQGEKYNYVQAMKNGLKYAKAHTDPEKAGFLAIDVEVEQSVHGYKNIYNSTYNSWCKRNNKKAVNESSPVEVLVSIHATFDGEDVSVTSMANVPVGTKKTIYIDVSEFDEDYKITGVRVAGQNYANLANKAQGGNDNVCGITDVKVKYSSIYIPGSKNSDLVTTTVNKGKVDMADVKNIKKLYDALPGLSADDYNCDEDYEKLSAFIKAWTAASPATQEYCEKEYGIDYTAIGMLEQDVFDKYINNWGNGDDGNYGTGDIAFPLASLLIAGVAGYVVIRTRRKKS